MLWEQVWAIWDPVPVGSRMDFSLWGPGSKSNGSCLQSKAPPGLWCCGSQTWCGAGLWPPEAPTEGPHPPLRRNHKTQPVVYLLVSIKHHLLCDQLVRPETMKKSDSEICESNKSLYCINKLYRKSVNLANLIICSLWQLKHFIKTCWKSFNWSCANKSTESHLPLFASSHTPKTDVKTLVYLF